MFQFYVNVVAILQRLCYTNFAKVVLKISYSGGNKFARVVLQFCRGGVATILRAVWPQLARTNWADIPANIQHILAKII
jgi:hypothetical protein